MDPQTASQPKPIRFVSAYDGPSRSKKRRTTAACRTCRKRKTKCDGDQPVCKPCILGGHVCLGYAESSRSQLGSSNARSERSPARGQSRESNISQRPATLLSEGSPPGVQEPRLLNRSAKTKKRPIDLRDHDQYSTETPRFDNEKLWDTSKKRSRTASVTPDESSTLSVPYFRYFGPTAIVPGFKQMVVRVKEHRPGNDLPFPASHSPSSEGSVRTPREAKAECLAMIESSLYDPSDASPLHPLIVHLVETFFIHLGSNFPFLRRDQFMPVLCHKEVETILVDAICAVAARFSTHPLLRATYSTSSDGQASVGPTKADYGQVFAQRAKSAVVDTFPCPTLASIQACLLLAYLGFGSGQDSALWMFLGCSIRMAQDLGLHKLEGIKRPHQQLNIPQGQETGLRTPAGPEGSTRLEDTSSLGGAITRKDPFEEERLDTFWAIHMLDRVISSGTGRPVTLRDEDIELPFPPHALDVASYWPRPFPALIRILHLYGRITDLLNKIRETKDVLPDMRRRLDGMEKDLTSIYQRLDARLTFNVVNFQHYVEAGEAANFVLLHFWFHTLIIILHQPSLLHSYDGSIHELFPNSRELSMSSAKTIADILAFAELVDAKSFISNPFTSQPIYVAACAFLLEIAAQTASRPVSRPSTPPEGPNDMSDNPRHTTASRTITSDHGGQEKHSLLASAAKQNYQRCYKALQQLEMYWAGIKYILTALDQKAEGVWDPETYTIEEMQRAKHHNALSANSPGTRRRVPMSKNGEVAQMEAMHSVTAEVPTMDISQMWTLNGNTNSRNANLTFLYKNTAEESKRRVPDSEWNSTPSGSISNTNNSLAHSDSAHSRRMSGTGRTLLEQDTSLQSRAHSAQAYEPIASHVEVDSRAVLPPQDLPTDFQVAASLLNSEQVHPTTTSPLASDYNFTSPYDGLPQSRGKVVIPSGLEPSEHLYTGMVGDMMIESQDIQMDPFGDDIFPYLEYIPHDLLGIFDNGVNGRGPIT